MTTIDCAAYGDLVAADVDNALSVEERQAVDLHVSTCPDCQAQRRQQLEVKQLLSEHFPRQETPAALRQAVGAALEHAGRPSLLRRAPRTRWVLAGAIAAGLLLAVMPVLRTPAPGLLGVLAQDVRAANAKELPLAVHTADAAELRGYYGNTGRIDFENSVEDLRSQGFNLVGGAVSEVGDSPTTLTMYEGAPGKIVCRRFRSGDIALPAGGRKIGNSELFTEDGVRIAITRLNGVVCCMATKMPEQRFVEFLHEMECPEDC